MPSVKFDPETRTLSIQLGPSETEEQLRFLADWLPQFLDRFLRDLGTAIGESLDSSEAPIRRHTPPPGVEQTPVPQRKMSVAAALIAAERRPGSDR